MNWRCVTYIRYMTGKMVNSTVSFSKWKKEQWQSFYLTKMLLFLAFEIQVLNTSAMKMLRQSQNFSVCFGNASAKKLLKTQQNPLHITKAMPLACLSIFPRAIIWFLNSWDYLFYLNYIVYLYNTLERVKQKTLFLLLVTLFWFLCESLLKQANRLSNARKTWCL